MQALRKIASPDLDLYSWFIDQAHKLRLYQPEFLDWSELAEELEEIVRLAKKETVSRLRAVLVHLLKWKYASTKRGEHSCTVTMTTQRLELATLLESKNLRNYLEEEGLALAYRQSRRLAGTEMRLGKSVWERRFPASCEWELSAVLDPDFFPTRSSPEENGSN